MNKHYKYDNILIEIYKISKEKFIVDYREIIHDPQSSIVDDINKHIKLGHKKGTATSSIVTNEILEETGHIIIQLKFLKFLSNDDESKSQREVEILRSFTFVDIEGFENSFTEIVINKENITAKRSPKNYSLLQFKYFIESIANQDINKFCELSSTWTDVLTEIFTIQNWFTFIFGFINEYDKDIIESKLSLDIWNKCKEINSNWFINYLEDCNISISQWGNGAVREEFQIWDLIYSELLFYIEKTFKEWGPWYYSEIKDMDQNSKFYFLANWWNKHKFSFDSPSNNRVISEVFTYVYTFFKSRARWKCLLKAKIEIWKVNDTWKGKDRPLSKNEDNKSSAKTVKHSHYNISNSNSNTIRQINDCINLNTLNIVNNKSSNSKENKNVCINNNNNNINESNNISSILPDISLYLQNNINNNNNNDIFEDNSLSINMSQEMAHTQRFHLEKTKNEMSTQRRSIESCLSHNWFWGLKKNLHTMFTGIFNRYTQESGCMGCDVVQEQQIPILDYDKIATEYKTMSWLQTEINWDKLSAISKTKKKEDCKRSRNVNNVEFRWDNSNLREIDTSEIKLHFYTEEDRKRNKQKINNYEWNNIITTNNNQLARRISQWNSKIDSFKTKQHSLQLMNKRNMNLQMSNNSTFNKKLGENKFNYCNTMN